MTRAASAMLDPPRRTWTFTLWPLVAVLLLSGLMGAAIYERHWQQEHVDSSTWNPWPADECPRGVLSTALIAGVGGPLIRACIVEVDNVARWRWMTDDVSARNVPMPTENPKTRWGPRGVEVAR